MARKVIRFTPDQLGYKDRGIVKWQGLMLSDHRDALKKTFVDNEPPKPKKVMDEIEISSVLQLAYLNKVPLNVQRNILVDGKLTNDLIGLVKGYVDDKVIIELKDGKTGSIYMEEIRNVEFGCVEIWYGK